MRMNPAGNDGRGQNDSATSCEKYVNFASSIRARLEEFDSLGAEPDALAGEAGKGPHGYGGAGSRALVGLTVARTGLVGPEGT